MWACLMWLMLAWAGPPAVADVLAGDRSAALALASAIGMVALDQALADTPPDPTLLAPGRRVVLQVLPRDAENHTVSDLRIATTPDGTVHLAWTRTWMVAERDHMGNNRLWKRRLWYAARSPDGTWSAPVDLGDSLDQIRLVVDRDGALLLLEGGPNLAAEPDALGTPPGHNDVRLRSLRGGEWSPAQRVIPQTSPLMHGFDAAVSPDNVVHLVWVPWFPDGPQNVPHLLRLGTGAPAEQLPSPRAVHSPVLRWTGERPVMYALGQNGDIVRMRYTPRGRGWHAEVLSGVVSSFVVAHPPPGADASMAWEAPSKGTEAAWHMQGPGTTGRLPIGPWPGSHGRTRGAIADGASVVTWGGGVYLVARGRGEWQTAVLRAPVRVPDAQGLATRFEDVWRVAVETDGDEVIAAWGSQGGEVAVWEGALDAAAHDWERVRWQALAGVGLTTAERAWLGETLLLEAAARPPEEAACLRHIVAEGLGNTGGPGYYAREQLRGAPVPSGCPASVQKP